MQHRNAAGVAVPALLTTMKPVDLFLYLVGNRRAIERIASSRHALWAGAMLVLSAGVARNYDHLYLVAQPEWIYGPFGMSLFSAIFIWLILRTEISRPPDQVKPPTFRTFLTLFWLTAPCAWLYGFPVERFTDLLIATQWNFAFLLVVSLWRVTLIVRAVTVLTGAGAGRILSFVLLPACIEMFAGSIKKGLSLIGIMGGVRLPPHHEFLKQASDFVATGSFYIGAVSLLAMIVYALGGWGLATRPLSRSVAPEGKGVIRAAAAFLLAWLVLAVPVQRPVSRNFQLNRYFANQQWQEGITYAAARQRTDFSPIHFLPPDPYGKMYGGWRQFSAAAYLDLLEAMDGSEPEWLRGEWSSQALMELELNLPFASQDKRVVKVLARYPAVIAGLAGKAERLKNHADLDWEDRDWLRNYQEVFEQGSSAKTVPP